MGEDSDWELDSTQFTFALIQAPAGNGNFARGGGVGDRRVGGTEPRKMGERSGERISEWGTSLLRECARAQNARGVEAAEAVAGLVRDAKFGDEWRKWKESREGSIGEDFLGAACDWTIENLMPRWERDFLVGLKLQACTTEKCSVELRTALIIPAGHPWIRISCTGGKQRRVMQPKHPAYIPWMRQARPSLRKWLFQVCDQRRAIPLYWSGGGGRLLDDPALVRCPSFAEGPPSVWVCGCMCVCACVHVCVLVGRGGASEFAA